MNAQVQTIGDVLNEERAYIAANQENVATQLARKPANRAEVMGEIACWYEFALVLSLNDDAELGRFIREHFWKAMHEKARNECEYVLAERAPLYSGPKPLNPVCQDDSGE